MNLDLDDEGREMVPLVKNKKDQWAKQATNPQRRLLAELCRQDGIDPSRLKVRTCSEARMLLDYWLNGVGMLRGYSFCDGRGWVSIKSRVPIG